MPAPQEYSTRALRDLPGQDFGASAPTTVDQKRINTPNVEGPDKPAPGGDVLLPVMN
jgi:hypothetical protein